MTQLLTMICIINHMDLIHWFRPEQESSSLWLLAMEYHPVIIITQRDMQCWFYFPMSVHI